MKILVTGGAGFIGSNLVDELIYNHEVTVLDDYLEKVHPECDIIRADITRNINVGNDFDAIIHLASITDTTLKPDSKMLRDNLNGFYNALNIALNSQAKLIYASSAAVYGNGDVPMTLSQMPKPLNAYGKSKWMMDKIAVQNYDKKINIIGLRFFNVFGPNESKKGSSASMIYHLRNQILCNSEVKLFEDGEQRRDHIYVKDVVSAIIKALDYQDSGIFNVGTGVSTSFNDLLDMIRIELKQGFAREYIPNKLKEAYQNHTLADISLTKKELGWEPKYTLQQGIKEYYEWIDENGP